MAAHQTDVSNTILSLAEEWAQAGVNKGDVVLLHSDIKRTLKRYLREGRNISPNILLESFLSAVGETGTLLLPLFNFDFTRGVPFDIRYTPSQMGALSEAGRLFPKAVRTGHPIYSFAVIGAQAQRFAGVNNFSGYDKDSPFAILRALNGRIAVLDLPEQRSMTFYHHVEQLHEVPYRYHKTFAGEYTDQDGVKGIREYGLFVRDLVKGVVTHVAPAGELMWQEGLYKGFRPFDGPGLRVVSANRMYDFVSDIISSGRAQDFLYAIHIENL
ncbi:MAG: AAC(3) family N-acetyltransferase [Candidatus Omnitrophica bacterium]|nr:AAC(3) family N-acetyltransferase [Candidatus Omnitrophota bacterium]